jgi:dihydropteroate synthase
MQWRCRHRTIDLTRPVVMGILNVTPDSFSDGNRYATVDAALERAARIAEEGAAIIDVGGESTRPGAQAVDEEVEIARIVPVIEGVAAASNIAISIDSSKPRVMAAAVAAGACIVNDVYALRAPGARSWAAVAEVGVCLMHMQGEPRTMQLDPRYDDVVTEVTAFLEKRMSFAVASGVREERICLDPGIGFGKTVDHNVELLRRLDVLLALGRPVLIGFSRKSSLGKLAGDPDAKTGPLGASVAAAVAAYERGATILRVHDVREHVDALAVARALA